jgi:origin recognition complex subunit 1
VSPASIISRCTIAGSPTKRATENFVCSSALNGQKGIYYSFSWPEHHARALQVDIDSEDALSGAIWDVLVEELDERPAPGPTKEGAKRQRKSRTRENEPSDSGGEDDYTPGEHDESDVDEDVEIVPDSESEPEPEPEEEEVVAVPRTPSRRGRRGRAKTTSTTPRRSPKKAESTVTTPRRPRTVRSVAAPTPHSKAALRARTRTARVQVRPPPLQLSRSHYDALQQ